MCSTLRVYLSICIHIDGLDDGWPDRGSVSPWLLGKKGLGVSASQPASQPNCTCCLSPSAAPGPIKKELHARVSPKNVETEKGGAYTHTQEVVSTGASSWKINIYKNGEKKEKENNVCSCLVFIVHYHHIQVETLLIFISASLCVHIHNNTHRRWCVHLVTAHNNRPDERGTKCSEKSNNENGGKKICIIIPKTSCWLWLSWIAVVTSSLSSAAQTADS